MSVPKNKRGESPVAYFDHAYKLYEDIVKFLLSDLGTKPGSKDLVVFVNTAHMSADDIILFNRLVEEYRLEYETCFPMWLLDHYREQILRYLDALIEEITFAHTMYPNSMYEFNKRREHQTNAISNCHALKHQLQLAIKLLPANLSVLIPYAVGIDKEIELLKSWRKDSNKLKAICYKNDSKIQDDIEHKIKVEIIKEYKKKNLETQKIIFSSFLNGEYSFTYDNMKPIASIPIPAVTFYKNGTKDYGIDDIVSFGLE